MTTLHTETDHIFTAFGHAGSHHAGPERGWLQAGKTLTAPRPGPRWPAADGVSLILLTVPSPEAATKNTLEAKQ